MQRHGVRRRLRRGIVAEHGTVCVRRVRVPRQRSAGVPGVDDACGGRSTQEWQHCLRNGDDTENAGLPHLAQVVEWRGGQRLGPHDAAILTKNDVVAANAYCWFVTLKISPWQVSTVPA
jgi:hypothetical protein